MKLDVSTMRLARTLSPDPLLRRFAGLTNVAIAERCGVHLSTVERWHRGQRIAVEDAYVIAGRLGSTVSDVWFPEVPL